MAMSTEYDADELVAQGKRIAELAAAYNAAQAAYNRAGRALYAPGGGQAGSQAAYDAALAARDAAGIAYRAACDAR